MLTLSQVSALCLLLGSGVIAEDGYGEINKTSPLQISTHDLILKVGTSATAYVTPSDTFNTSFEGASEAKLVFEFQSGIDWVIAKIPDIPLVVNGTQILKNASVEIKATNAGRVVVISEIESVPSLNLTAGNIFLRIITYKSSILLTVAEIVGWIYFVAWSISFYPQIYQNWRRKSVRGYSLDFAFLNVTGFVVYGIYNSCLFWIPEVQDEYTTKYPTGEIPVQINDVIFSIHAIMASGITLLQCMIYDRGSQTVSNTGKMLLMFIYLFLIVMIIIALSNHAVTWLAFLTVCSYVKLFITLIKYVPQAHMNWARKSTSGWCIGNILLDLTGGIFSLLQMIIIGYNHNDWWSLLTDLTKFGLGFFSICFDILFIIQHYILYRNHEAYDPLEGNDTAVDPYEDMVTSNNIGQDDGSDRASQRSSSSASSTSEFPRLNAFTP